MVLSSETPLTQHELPVYLESAQRPEVRRWVVLTPLAKDEYDMKTRILDLVHRMMAAKIHGQEPLRFSVYRRMHVGLGGIRVDVQTRLAAYLATAAAACRQARCPLSLMLVELNEPEPLILAYG